MQKAAEQGFGNAQGMLGIFYSSDKMCPKDLVKACVWLKVSASEFSSLNSDGRQCSGRCKSLSVNCSAFAKPSSPAGAAKRRRA